MCINDIFLYKIDMFMQKNIVNSMDPSKVFWWISVSGGKDSYAMALALHLWYKKNNYKFNGEAIFINQWNNYNIYNYLCEKIDWMPVTCITAIDETRKYTNYTFGSQAPCSKCSMSRKVCGDRYVLDNYKDGYYNVIARGLHLTDMAISYLWRYFWGIDTIDFAKKIEKGNPLEKLNLEKNIYLAKPLCFVREYESELFSNHHKYRAICCGCPACAFPSRRDIVEESLRQLYVDELWEFKVKGIKTYLNKIGSFEKTIEYSIKGKENKHRHLTTEFTEYALDFWKSREKVIKNKFHKDNYLDNIGQNYIVYNSQYESESIFAPKFLSEVELTTNEKLMIATVGPFWGAVGYANKKIRDYILNLQYEIYDIKIDILWSQVNTILQSYYKKRGLYYEKNKNNNFYRICNCHYIDYNNSGIPNL